MTEADLHKFTTDPLPDANRAAGGATMNGLAIRAAPVAAPALPYGRFGIRGHPNAAVLSSWGCFQMRGHPDGGLADEVEAYAEIFKAVADGSLTPAQAAEQARCVEAFAREIEGPDPMTNVLRDSKGIRGRWWRSSRGRFRICTCSTYYYEADMDLPTSPYGSFSIPGHYALAKAILRNQDEL
jgi:hypothetical protein